MSPLTPEQIKGFVRVIEQTREREFNCSECQSYAGEFAERQLAGLPLDEVLARVEHHLIMCPECREEFAALEKILRESE
jgi:Zn finger protein HypA/HybF involved in hydrogenase expression